MIALEHLQTNALLIVLFGALLTLFTLRVAVYLSQRARVARDLALIDSLTLSTTRSRSPGDGLRTPHAEPITRAGHSDARPAHARPAPEGELVGAPPGSSLGPGSSLESSTSASTAGHHLASGPAPHADHDARPQRDPLR